MDTATYYLVSQSCEPWTESISKSHERIRMAHTFITAKCKKSLKLTIVSVNECGMKNASNSISVLVVTSNSCPSLTSVVSVIVTLMSVMIVSLLTFSVSLMLRIKYLSATMQVSKFKEDSKSTCEADYMGLPSTAIIGK